MDASTGAFEVTETLAENLDDLLQTLSPVEVLVDRTGRERLNALRAVGFTVTRREDWVFADEFARTTLLDHFETHSLRGIRCGGFTGGSGSGRGCVALSNGNAAGATHSHPAPAAQGG